MKIVFLALVASPVTLFSAAYGQQDPSAVSRTALPIVITKSVSAKNAHPGDVVYAKTTQASRLPDGTSVPSGSRVFGRVVSTSGSVTGRGDAISQESYLTIRFDFVQIANEKLPLNAHVRAMADPIASEEAQSPAANDIDPKGALTQIGGDQITPSLRDVVDQDGRIVAQNRRHGVYARLLPNSTCSGTDIEVSVGIYSASACGLYGFTGIHAGGIGSPHSHPDLTLSSTEYTPKVWRNTTALLEVVGAQREWQE
ncbi:hypothetical protein [Edaphobacter bradus]|uniref:hypothetical protein n=1 Tax=Edaphobacter bradus TaxID=2259016 RepID=UPI0021E0C8AE|nr:hypothetical protein [Edaphobacter bradus]